MSYLKYNIPFSQFNRLQKGLLLGLKKAKIQAVNHQKVAEQAMRDAEKAKMKTLDQTIVAEDAHINAKTDAVENKNVGSKALRDAAEANLTAKQTKAQFEAVRL